MKVYIIGKKVNGFGNDEAYYFPLYADLEKAKEKTNELIKEYMEYEKSNYPPERRIIPKLVGVFNDERHLYKVDDNDYFILETEVIE